MEIWKPVVGYEWAYEVSSLGRVRSKRREIHYVNGRVDIRESQIKSQRPRKDGYYQVNVSQGSKKAVLLVHQEVCKAFHGQNPGGKDVCHTDGNRSNNCESNLRWDTRKGNFGDMVEHGTRCRGERHGQVKLTDAQVEAIRADPRRQWEIAEWYGITQGHVSRLKLGKQRNWG